MKFCKSHRLQWTNDWRLILLNEWNFSSGKYWSGFLSFFTFSILFCQRISPAPFRMNYRLTFELNPKTMKRTQKVKYHKFQIFMGDHNKFRHWYENDKTVSNRNGFFAYKRKYSYQMWHWNCDSMRRDIIENKLIHFIQIDDFRTHSFHFVCVLKIIKSWSFVLVWNVLLYIYFANINQMANNGACC